MSTEIKDFRLVETVQDLADAQAEFAAAMSLAIAPARSLSKAGLVRLLKAVVLTPIIQPDMSQMSGAELDVFMRLLVLLDRKQMLLEAMALEMDNNADTGPSGEVA